VGLQWLAEKGIVRGSETEPRVVGFVHPAQSSGMAACHPILVSSVWGYDWRVKRVLPSWPFRKQSQWYIAAPMLTGNGCPERSCLR